MAKITDYLKRLINDALEVPTQPTKTPLEAGLEAWRAGDAAAAVPLLAVAIQLMPAHTEATLAYGRALLAVGRHADALAPIQAMLTAFALAGRKQAAAEVAALAGEAHEALGQVAGAEASYRKAIALAPTYTDGHIRLGVLLFSQNRLSEALEALNTGVFLDRQAAVARFYLVRTCLALGDNQRALSQIHLLGKLKADYAPAHMLAAIAYERLGNHRQAVIELERVVALGAADDEAHFRLGRAHLTLGATDQALDAWGKVGATHPAYGEAQLEIATMQEAARRYRLALAAYHNLLRFPRFHAESKAGVSRIMGLLKTIDQDLTKAA